MSDHAAFIDQILRRSAAVVSDLKASDVIGTYIDASLPVPRPFVGTGPIRLVVVGQDPTVEKLESRERVKTVLTLDQKDGNLYRFVERICTGLGLSLEQHLYATNVCKNFFTELPERVYEPDLIGISWLKWRALLAEELDRFPGATVVTLGKPILKVLVCQPLSQDLKHYWGHVEGWKTEGIGGFRYVDVEGSSLRRQFFPLPHITNTRTTELYRTHFDGYLTFIRANTGKEVV
jgi:uracil-DNA glycosylase